MDRLNLFNTFELFEVSTSTFTIEYDNNSITKITQIYLPLHKKLEMLLIVFWFKFQFHINLRRWATGDMRRFVRPWRPDTPSSSNRSPAERFGWPAAS